MSNSEPMDKIEAEVEGTDDEKKMHRDGTEAEKSLDEISKGAQLEDTTNILQSLDTTTGQWRRLPNLDTRMTVLHMFSHNDSLHLLGWQPARNNFLLCLDKRTGASKVVLSGLEGVWSRGVVARGQHLNKLLQP